MPSAAARRARPSGGDRLQRKRGRGTSVKAASQPLEQRILITATLCLLAFGAVMVYSASSATSLLQGGGTGSGYLVKYLIYGAIGLVVMRVLARGGVEKVEKITPPLLAARSCSCSRCTSRTSASASTARAAGSAPGRSSSSRRS